MKIKTEFELAKSGLANALRSLNPTGARGFEGLLRDILVEVTKLSFGLAKSGPQDGSDVRSLGLNLFEVALEAKRYGEKTDLKVDALKAKLFETWSSRNGTDLWILAATRSISATDNETLTLAGKELGITVLILDWPVESDQLPDLAVLCAEAENALTNHLGDQADIGEIVTAIRAHPNYFDAASRLRSRLVAPDVGYAAATHTLKQWMLDGLASDRNAASRLGGKFNNMLDPHRVRISRRKYEAQPDQWFSNGGPGVLLGNEGLGKTWLFFSWWHSRSNSSKDLPLTLFVPAKEVGQESLDMLIARLLEKHLGHGNVGFWRRRIDQWLKLRPDGPQVLLMIDGLNQHWLKRDWADFLQTAFDDQWNGRISILMSCWPDHWSDLHKLSSLTPQPSEIAVERFDDSELNELLSVHGLRRESFGTAMLELMKAPRLSALAIARQRDLIVSGDITPERLAVEDWKHRIELRGSQLALTDAEFQSFVAELGTQFRRSIDDTVLTRQNVFERLGRDSGKERSDLLSTVAELISGQWIVSTGKAHQFRVNPELVPFALGMALTYQLKPTNSLAAANMIIAEYIDPFSGQSLGVHILRAAVTVALLDSSVFQTTRRALLTRWISEQNFSQLDFEAFWRIIGLDIELILQIIEENWLNESADFLFTDEIIIKGLANAYQFNAVASHIETKITRWLGWFWNDPLEGNVLGQIDLTSSDSQQRQKSTAANVYSWQSFDGHGVLPAIEFCSSGNPSWLSHRALGLISFLPRARFIEAIGAWSVSRAVMGMPQHFERLAWALRLNREDPVATDTEVMNLVDRLVGSSHRLALDAACWLLKALASPQAEGRLRKLQFSNDLAANTSPQLFSTSDDDILDPSIELDLSDYKSAAQMPPADMDALFLSSHEMLILARTNPIRLRELIGEKAMSAKSLAPSVLRKLLVRIDAFLPVLSEVERGVLKAAIDKTLEENFTENSKESEWWRVRKLELQLAGKSGFSQLEFLLYEPDHCKLLTSVRIKILDFTQNDLILTLERFQIEDDKDKVLNWLKLLVEFADHQTIDGWPALRKLICHTDTHIAELAIALASKSTDPSVLKVIAESCWTATEATDRTQRYNRSLALIKAYKILKHPHLLERADKEVMATWLQSEPDNPDAIRAYESFIRETISNLKSRSRTSVQPLISHRDAVAILLNRADEDFWSWLDQMLTNESTISELHIISDFPLVVLAETMMSIRPKLGLTLWESIKKTTQNGIIKMPHLTALPFMAPSELTETARDSLLAEAFNDQYIADVVRQAEQNGQTAWLVQKALRFARSGETAALAMSSVLLGFADESDSVEIAWAEIKERIPSGGWLEKVYRQSRRNYDRNLWARHWYTCFLQATTDAEAIAAQILLGATIDNRAARWIDHKRLSELSTHKRRFWDLNSDSLTSANKKQRDELKDTLFWTNTIKQTQWPWL